MLSARLSRFDGEFVQPLRLIAHMLAAAEAINRQPHGLVQGPRLQFDRVLNSVRIPERHPTALHLGRISYSLFVRYGCSRFPSHFPRLLVLAQAHKSGVSQVAI